MNISFLLKTYSPPYSLPQPPPQDLFCTFTPIPIAPQKHPLCPFLPLSSGDPRPFPCAFLKPALFAEGNGRALQPVPSVTNAGFVILTPLQAIPLSPSLLIWHLQSTCHPICSLQGRSGSRWVAYISQLGVLSFKFFLPLNKMLEQRKNKEKKLA